MPTDPKTLIDKIKALPSERIDEVEDFVDFLAARSRDEGLTRAAASASANSFARVWDNPEDSVYDEL
jgi:hypothetical protein